MIASTPITNSAVPYLPHCCRLSVIIPVYNAANTLGKQLDALKAQSYTGAWEIIIVNNLSIDQTVEVVRHYQMVMPNVRLVEAMRKQGRSYACNVGVQFVRGDWVIFCDADDVAAPGWLSAFDEALTNHPVVAGSIEVNRLNATAPWRPLPFVNCKSLALGFLPYLPGANMGISRAIFVEMGGFAEDIPPCEDIDFAWRLQLKGYALHDAPAAVMHIRYRSTLKDFWKQIVSYADAHVFLYRRFAADGMPRSSIRAVLRQYKWLLREAPRLLRADPATRHKWLRIAAGCWGRFCGSLRYCKLYL